MDDLSIIQRLNYALMDLERETAPTVELAYPILFVIGPPRSGTTVFTQFLAYGLMTGYITNIAARFWNAPTLGVRVSRNTLGDDPAGDMGKAFFESKQGQTPYGGGIHEFGYFWKSICWESPKLHKLDQIQQILGKPLVMKGIYPSRHIDLVRDQLGEKAKFIAVQRPFNDMLASVVRLWKESGKMDYWFRGWELPTGLESVIEFESPVERIAVRLFYWLRYSERVADFKIYLPNICNMPNTVLNAIARCIEGIDAYREIPNDWIEYHGYDLQDHQFLTSERFKRIVDTVTREIR